MTIKNKLKEIVVISGKGGTGKTSLTASFAMLAGKEAVIADCDVDAADLHLLLEPDILYKDDFYSGLLAEIDQNICTLCGKCSQVCRFNAIEKANEKFKILKLECEGCGYCAEICPVKAIEMVEQNVGEWYLSKIKSGSKMVHASMKVGAENSGKLVAKVKNEAKRVAQDENKSHIIVDGSPGVGCPVVSSLSGADYVILVTEPSVSGIHDLKRVYELVEKFNLNTGCIINKQDLNREKTRQIKFLLNQKKIELIAELPYDEDFTRAMTAGYTIIEYDNNKLKKVLEKSWHKVLRIINQKGEE
mgnify:CR=1 FL=1